MTTSPTPTPATTPSGPPGPGLERDALVAELTRSVGRGGRPRRLGDDTEKARKTVTARIHRALRLLDTHHPALAAHLRQALHTGTTCSYEPAHPIDWEL